MNFSHLNLKCYPTRVDENLKNNYKTKQNKTPGMRNPPLFLSGCLGVCKRLPIHLVYGCCPSYLSTPRGGS